MEYDPVCGGIIGDSFETFNLDGLSSKMSLPLLAVGCTAFSKVLPSSGIMLNGTLYQLTNMGPHTTAIGYSLLPTPTKVAIQGLGKNPPVFINGLKIWEHRTWEMTQLLQYRLIGLNFGLKGYVPVPKEKYDLSPEFVEWMMGYETGFTDVPL